MNEGVIGLNKFNIRLKGLSLRQIDLKIFGKHQTDNVSQKQLHNVIHMSKVNR